MRYNISSLRESWSEQPLQGNFNYQLLHWDFIDTLRCLLGSTEKQKQMEKQTHINRQSYGM